MKEKILLGLLGAILIGCSNKKIEITNEYIVNENWSKKNEEASANSITINKMKVIKDSIIDPFSILGQTEILNKLEVDSSFFYFANIKIRQGENYIDKKIYFADFNGFYWGSKNRFSNNNEIRAIGNLKPGNWYRFSDLGTVTRPNYIFVYIDSGNQAHRFDVNLSNY